MTLLLLGHNGMDTTTKGQEIRADDFIPGTEPAFRQAMAAKGDGYESDVSLTKDKIAVICRGEEVLLAELAHRNQTPRGSIQNYTLEELKTFNLGNGTTIMTLQELLAVSNELNGGYKTRSGHNLRLYIDYKDPDVMPVMNDTIVHFLRHSDLSMKDFVFWNAKADVLQQLRDTNPEAQVLLPCLTGQLFHESNIIKPTYAVKPDATYDAQLLEKLTLNARDLSAYGLDVFTKDLFPPLVAFARQRDLVLSLNVPIDQQRDGVDAELVAKILAYSRSGDVMFLVDNMNKVAPQFAARSPREPCTS